MQYDPSNNTTTTMTHNNPYGLTSNITSTSFLIQQPTNNGSNILQQSSSYSPSALNLPPTTSFKVGDVIFTLDARFQYVATKGIGAYGVVVAVRDTITGKSFAVKKISRAFDDQPNAKRIIRECMLLRQMRHENIVTLYDIPHPRTSVDDFSDVYMIMDLMDTDLHRIIYSRQPLLDEHVQFFTYQILRALKYIHSAGIIHRDIKPSNLLVDASCDLKICDFGLARTFAEEDDKNLTEYVVTRWYRAPEVMLTCKSYTCTVDVWSTGVIMAELIGRKPLLPGDNYIHQLQLMNEVLGSSTDEQLSFVSSEKARRFMLQLPHRPRIPFTQRFPNINPLAADLLDKMLVLNPAHRISVDAALQHPYLSAFSRGGAGGGGDNPNCDHVVDFQFEKYRLDMTAMKEIMWQEMCQYHPAAMVDLNERNVRGQLRMTNLPLLRPALG